MMVAPLVACAMTFGFASAACLGTCAALSASVRKNRRKTLAALGAGSPLAARSLSLECRGMTAYLIEYAARCSLRSLNKRGGFLLARRGRKGNEVLLTQSGLIDVLSAEGCAQASLHVALFACVVGLLAGLVMSLELAIIGALVGAWWGSTALRRALRTQARERSFVAERELAHMIEVVVLGLKSGMSFDRALELYTTRFEGSLAQSLAIAQGQWAHGLCDRKGGLRKVAESYNSPLFDRFAEGVIRSLRFGTSLADSLNVLALEARAIRKAKLEEKVAKAPVKMLLPVGGLILPAMLILILGPILLDLMSGF